MSVPQSLTFDIASHVLRKIWSNVVARSGNYDGSIASLSPFSRRPKNEVSLRTILGLKAPSSQTGVTAQFLNEFFTGMAEAQREAYFNQGAPIGFDTFMREMRGNSEFRLQINQRQNLVLLELTARTNRDGDPDLYHLSTFFNPTALSDRRLHFNVHITQEPSATGRRTYYRFDNVFGPILREDNMPVAPRPRQAPQVRPREARGPPRDETVRRRENFARRRGQGRRKRTQRRTTRRAYGRSHA